MAVYSIVRNTVGPLLRRVIFDKLDPMSGRLKILLAYFH